MSRISFNTPIFIREEKKNHNVKLHKSINFFESLFSWSGKCYEVSSLKNLKGKKIIQLSKKDYNPTFFEKALKIVAYITLILPIIAIIAKLLYRNIEKFELSKDDALVANLKLNLSNLHKKPKPIPIPTIHSDVDITTLPFMAMSLNIPQNYITNITVLCEVSDYRISTYLKAIVQGFNEKDVGPNLRAEILTNIGRDCGPGICFGGISKKLYKEFNRLYGVDAESVEEIFLNEIHDLKIEFINQIANTLTPPLEQSLHPHFINAFQVHLGNALGLEVLEANKDEISKGNGVAKYFYGIGITDMYDRFLELYTPSMLVDIIYNSINAKEDAYNIVLHISDYQKFIFHYLKENVYKKPMTIKELLNGPLKKYAESALEEVDSFNNNLSFIYKAALNGFIQDTYFHYNETLFACTKLKKEACILILKIIGILEA